MTRSRHVWMLIGVVAGAALGVGLNALHAATGDDRLLWVVDYFTHPVGQIFLRLLFMLVIPLLFSALVVGVAELDLRQLGRVGGKTIAYTVVVSTIAVLIGMILVNLVGPGRDVPPEVRELARSSTAPPSARAPADSSPVSILINMVPRNPLEAAVNGDMIGLLVFSLLFGVALSLTRSDAARALQRGIQGLYDVSMTLIDWVLALAPVGVGALLFSMSARQGAAIFQILGAYVAVVIGGLALHMFGVYSLTVWLLGRMNPVAFFRGARAAMLTAFSTASSNATLPTALKVAEEELHIPRHVARFVLTAGAAMNQNGTALFEGVTVLFLAQLFGVDLTLTQQATIMGICVLAGIGTAGVPAGSIPVIAMILGMFGIPPEGLGLILGVDRLLDMCRTTLNVTGDLAAAVVVSRGEEHAARETTLS